MTTQLHDAYSIPLEAIDVSDPQLYPYFERLRREAPVHYCRESRYGPYWSVCKYKDIMQVEVNHGIYSSELGGIAVEDPPKGLERESFIRMDPPKHDEQRKVVGPIVAPPNLAEMEATIRERTIRVLEGLPRNEIFDWVERVSVELTTMMLATLFDYPLGRPASADLLVRRRDLQCPCAGIAGAFGTGEVRRVKENGGADGGALQRARQAAAEIRSVVDARPWPGDAEHAAARILSQTLATWLDRYTAAWPAELPPPTNATSCPAHSLPSSGDAQ